MADHFNEAPLSLVVEAEKKDLSNSEDRSPLLSPVSTVMMSEPNYNWVEITKEFFTAVKVLDLGELLHDELFGLFEAMSAIEMMDPKMDAGMFCNRGNKAALTFDQAVQTGKLKLEGLTLSEQIGNIDNTYACLVSWLEGHSLAQTVFTNLYLHKPYQIQDKPLKVFCIAIYKIVYVIKDFVNRGLVFEEEDFQPSVYGYVLNPDVNEQRAITMLREVEDELGKTIRSKNSDSPDFSEQEDILALQSRIRFTRLFYQSLTSLNKQMQTANVGECTKLLTTTTELIPTILKTLDRGVQPIKSSEPHTGGSIMIGFESLVNQRLLPPTFPRYTKIKSRTEAYHYIDELLSRLKQACKVTTCTSFHTALDMFIELSRSNPCIVSRSVMQLLYMPQCNRSSAGPNNSCAEALRDAVKAFISPPALSPRSSLLNNPVAKDCVDAFLNHCVRPFTSLIQLCGHNRARQRDKLAHLIEDFAALQDEAERVDAFLDTLSTRADPPRTHFACFGNWILYHSLRVMIMFLLSGFELELYSTHEYHYIFWYLYEFLYGWLVSSLTRADTKMVDQDLAGTSRSQRRNKPKKKKVRPYAREIILNQALQNMCGGYYKAMVGFRLDGKLRQPCRQFDFENVRYEHRFAPFNGLITPPPVSYSEFHELTSGAHNNTPEGVYFAGCKHFQQARSLLDSITNPDNEVIELSRIAKTNFVVLKVLATGHKKNSTEPPDFDFSSHHHFPIIKLP
uniref:Protein MAK10 homolog n=1 Tax=Clastoptera arizonana TaxID=38151 RepID=A0A1B6C3I9_9HEMI